MTGFSAFFQETDEAFSRFLQASGEKLSDKIKKGLEENELSPTEKFFVEWQYLFSPLSDAAMYDFSLFVSCARHAAVLLAQSPYVQGLSGEKFLAYVLHPRVNDEELSDCRAFFYHLLKDRIQGLSFEEAVKEINYFCAENVRYVSTDERTRSALSVFESGFGRCGEESTFCVNALRACGIAARQVYAPRWSHCDDNHAWVEVFDGTKWRFLGACEPEETLDHGWFCAAASRAMFVYARRFCDTQDGETIGKHGMVRFENALKKYAAQTTLRILVKDESGAPVSHAKVTAKILNYARFCPVLALTTDNGGCAEFPCGLGSLYVCARHGGLFAEKIVNVEECAVVELTLKKEFFEEKSEAFCFFAPKGGATQNDLAIGKETLALWEQKRERAKRCYQEKLDRREAQTAENTSKFLENPAFSLAEKEGLYAVLSDKDREELKEEVLLDALACAKPYRANFKDGEFFDRFVSCPRVSNEVLTPHRKAFEAYFTKEEQKAFQDDPRKIYQYIEEKIVEDEERSYAALITSPLAALTFGRGDRRSKDVLFVAICRTLGIPSRLNAQTGETEYFANGKFQTVHNCPRGELALDLSGGLSFGKDLSLSRVNLDEETELELSNELFESGKALSLPCGMYRLIAVNRLPSGNTLAVQTTFALRAGEQKRLSPIRPQADLSDMLFSVPLDFLSSSFKECFSKEESCALLLLCPAEEPTEHLLSELLTQESEIKRLSSRIVLALAGGEETSGKIKRTLEKFPNMRRVNLERQTAERLARALYLEPDRFPIALLFHPFPTAVYASGGYNVGSVDLIIKLLNYLG